MVGFVADWQVHIYNDDNGETRCAWYVAEVGDGVVRTGDADIIDAPGDLYRTLDLVRDAQVVS